MLKIQTLMADYFYSEGRISASQLCLEILESLGNVRCDLHNSPLFFALVSLLGLFWLSLERGPSPLPLLPGFVRALISSGCCFPAFSKWGYSLLHMLHSS